MKKLIGVLLLYCLVFDTFGQYVTFRKAIGNNEDDFAACVRETNDLGFIVAGTTGSVENTNSDIYLFKLDSLGNLQWSKHFGTSYGSENGKKVIQTIDNGFIVIGFTNSLGNGGYDMYVIKTDSIGQEVWSKTYGGNDWDFANDVVILPNGNYGIAGHTYSFGNGGSDGYFIEIDDDGNEISEKTYGGPGEERANAITLTADNKLMICGEIKNDAQNPDGYIVKAELNGDSIWTKVFGGDSTDYFADIISTNDGNCLAVGATSSFGLVNTNYYFVKIDNSGTIIFERNDGGGGEEEAREVAENQDGAYAMLGYSSSAGAGGRAVQLFLVSSGGWWVNSPQYGSSQDEDGYSIDYTHDNGYILAGITNGYNAVKYDALIIKTDSVGNTGLTGDVINITDNLVGVYEVVEEDFTFSVYTSFNSLFIKSPKKQFEKAQLYNLSGQLVYESLLNQSSWELDMSLNYISPGIYFVKIYFQDNYTKSVKVLINK